MTCSVDSRREPGKQPFVVVPWNADFLDAVRAVVSDATDGKPDRAVVVFPHSRPKRYLMDGYRRQARLPLLLPRLMTGQELREWCREAWSANGVQPRRADVLDRVALLWDSVNRIARNPARNSSLNRLIAGGMTSFFPWGVRLDCLLEECLAQMVDAQDLRHAEGEVEPFAAALLGELRGIREDYLRALADQNLTTPGLDAHAAAGYALRNPEPPPFMRDKVLVLAGFVSLTRAEDILLRFFWNHGALICLHSDPALAEGRAHWACENHAAWIRRWGADCRVFGSIPGRRPRLHFFAGYDLHSQLRELRAQLARHEREDRTADGTGADAVVLPHPALLMPTLHHLPRKDINISLGYPLDRSLLARLLETVFRVREKRRPDGRTHWRPLLDLIRHPYVRMLRLPPDAPGSAPSSGGRPLRPLLRMLEGRLRSGTRLANPAALVTDLLEKIRGGKGSGPATGGDIDEALGHGLEHVMAVLVENWSRVETLRGAAAALAALCDLLLTYGRPIWPRFPLDAECLFRLMQRLVPQLADNALADDALPPDTLFAMIRQRLGDERVPFEADPLTGLQVLGMLETRLLRFDRVYLMDLTEDALPGAPRHDPLLPDTLRGLLGLPDTRQREMLAAHTFHRLAAGARDLYLFWQEGVESSGLLDSKKVRSRFVEEALWLEEKNAGRRLAPGEAPLRAAAFPLVIPSRRDRAVIARSERVAAKMEELLAAPLAPTLLEAYIRCPARFFWERLCAIRPLGEVHEGDDPSGVGDLLHTVLRRAYEPYVGRTVRRGDIDEARLKALFRESLDAWEGRENLPAESLLMLKETGPLRLSRFLENQPDEAYELLEVEATHTARLEAAGHPHVLYGTLDRVDARPEGDIILDYKSGRSIKVAPPAFWLGDDVWERMEDWAPGPEDPLPGLADALPGIQLPCYLYLYSHGNPPDEPRAAADAAWIHLAGDGKEISLLGSKISAEDRAFILNTRIPALLRFVLTHMRNAPELRPQPGRHCQWCPYTGACR
ncbi:MAG: PD-(D/E)XK nuclease family protein [Desulfovibrionaceae bacterium]|nr:PD-(D/E)XK nuclease family protein [Desulfovibrionaceae bacterium]